MPETVTTAFCMDYKRIDFLFCDDGDTYNIMEQVRQLQGTGGENPVLFHTPGEEEMAMPFSVTGGAHYEVGDKYFTRRSQLDSYQLILTCSGHCQVETGSHRYDCTKGTVLLMDCRAPHVYRVPKGECWDYKHIHFEVDERSRRVADKALGFIAFPESDIERRIDEIFWEMRHFSANSPYILSNHVSNMLTEMIQLRSQAAIIRPHMELIEKAAKYMRGHYMEKININDLAKNEFVSVFYFTRLFKDYYGTSPYDYLVKYRLNKSKNMLAQGRAVKEIAQECGFGNANNFSRIFKKHTGISPNQFRAQFFGSAEEA